MKPVKRKYKMADAKLIQLADDLLGSAARDAAELANYGVDTAYTDAIEVLRDDFSNTPTDNELMGEMMDATDARNNKATQVRNAIGPIATRFRVKYGETSGKYRGLSIDLLSQQDTAELVRTGRAVVRMATQNLAEVGQGLTMVEIDALTLLVGELDILVDEQRTAVKDRDIAVDDRIKKGNSLYEAIVKLAEYGKSAWLNVNESKYNDYVITETYNKPAQVLEGEIAMGMIVNLSVAEVQAVTTISAEASGNDMQIYFSVNPTDMPNGFQQTIANGTTGELVAGAIGFAEGTRERLMLYNPGPNPVTYKIVVEA
ncbi:MAG: hypothetical protein AB7G44_05685 [Bacteroidia bacterium]